MSAAPSMAEVLAKHAARWDHDESYYMPVACECGAERPDGPGSDELWHAAHVAQALAAAGFGHVASVEAERDGNASAARALIRGQAELGRRLAAAEARVAAVRALADEWESDLGLNRCPSCLHIPATDCDHGEGYHHALSDLCRTLDGEGGR